MLSNFRRGKNWHIFLLNGLIRMKTS
jgi:hypothetical protein